MLGYNVLLGWPFWFPYPGVFQCFRLSVCPVPKSSLDVLQDSRCCLTHHLGGSHTLCWTTFSVACVPLALLIHFTGPPYYSGCVPPPPRTAPHSSSVEKDVYCFRRATSKWPVCQIMACQFLLEEPPARRWARGSDGTDDKAMASVPMTKHGLLHQHEECLLLCFLFFQVLGQIL